MTDIEKKTFKVSLIRGVALAFSLIACTWKLSGGFSDAKTEFYGLKNSIIGLTASVNDLTRRDSLNKVEITELKTTSSHQGHDIDSLKRVLRAVVLRSHMKPGLGYYTERRVSGRIVVEESPN